MLRNIAFLDSLRIPHELNRFSATGNLKADCYVKTNFKKLKSNGSIIVKDGGVAVTGVGKVLSNANINILLDNSILDVKDSHLLVNNSKEYVEKMTKIINEETYSDGQFTECYSYPKEKKIIK